MNNINQFLAVLTCSSLSLIYGQTIGWSSAAVTQLEDGGDDLPSGSKGLDSITSGWIGGAYCLGACLFAPIHGFLADYRGRKFAAYFVAICLSLHWALIAIGTDMTYIFVARTLGGIGGAGAITIISIYSNEVADEKIRGILGSFLPIFYTIGILISYIMGAYLSYTMVVVVNLNISICFYLVWWIMPETPRYLVLCGNDEKAVKAIMWLRKCPYEGASKILTELKIQQKGAVKTASIKEFYYNKIAQRGLLLAGVLAALLSFCGIFAVNSYAGSIFKRAGNTSDPSSATIIYGSVMVVGAMIPPFFVDKFGRKILMGISFTLLTIGMGALASYFLALKLEYFREDDKYSVFIPIVALCECVLSCYIGVGSVTYTVMVELFSDEMRGIAGSILAFITWSTSFILLQFFKPAVEILGDYTVFYFFSFSCLFGAIFVYLYVPETRNKTFEEIFIRNDTDNNNQNSDDKCCV